MKMISNKLIRFYLVVLSAFYFYSCEVATDWKSGFQSNNLLVVNGILTNEKKAHEITLNYSPGDLNKKPVPCSGAFIVVYDGDSLYQFIENPSKSGIYKSRTSFRAFINKGYYLFISAEGTNYNSTAYMLPVTSFEPLKYKFDDLKQMYAIDSVTQVFNDKESALYEISIDWSNIPGYDFVPAESKKALLYYYSFNTLDVSEVFAPEKEKIYFPAGTQIIERKYSLTPEHAAFFRSMLLETEWKGGLFDVSNGNSVTNLSNGAVGYFGVCTVIEKTILVE